MTAQLCNAPQGVEKVRKVCTVIGMTCQGPDIKRLDSNTTNPALSGGKLDRSASGIGLHRETLKYRCIVICCISN